ncbi:CG9624 [Drosophila busckii]|uniref:CG9624 n=2 Tax=Drosophila busckii TaxID=30019 RepID=A0A0M3QXA7_DROBS|nr:CG9624 [Drosophila busckii]
METDTNSSQKEMETLDSSFFDTLWPLILNENKCYLESESTDYFRPRQQFKQLYWHTLLSKVGYMGYEQPHDLRCCGAARLEAAAELQAEKDANELALQQTLGTAMLADYNKCGSQGIRRVDQEVELLTMQQQQRQKLAYDFANRKFPWTMQTPSHELGFQLTPELTRCLSPEERELLESIHAYECKLMLIDASNDVCVDDFKRWIKFRPYVQILVTVRCPRVQRHLQLLGVFHTLLVEENIEHTWHEELHYQLRSGLREAQRLGLLENCAQAFVFVFSRYRNTCTCDTYKILRRT